MQARHERKHIINQGDYTILRSRLRAVLHPDANGGERGEYAVRSLYFDTPRDQALREKIDGVNNRVKYRIRVYNADPSFIRLEKKAKRDGLCYKTSTGLDHGEVRALLRGDTDWMRTSGDLLLIELYSKMKGELLRPKTVVDYIREPFTCPAGNVRITLDRAIRTGLYSTELFDEKMPLLPVGDGLALLEVKYGGFLPEHIANLLRVADRRQTAFSKYALCRIYG